MSSFKSLSRLVARVDDGSFAEGRAADDIHFLADASPLLKEEVTGAALLWFRMIPDSLVEQAHQL